MTQVIVGRWGKTLAVRFPAEVARSAGLRNGDRVEVIDQDGEVLIHKVAPNSAVGELFRGKTPEEWRDLYAGAYDWGPDRGLESIDG
ncbi:MAG TPA: AbrB/MazE/SpoVT family DNA-binding domain-containing protein [Caulobacteraceae bacterium]|nr:AbrB/MazE/SpoVT family DNA-binding domain-containing protein [Caulobacteraceae bacterium]